MDILSRLHALPLSRFHFRLLGLIGLGWLFDAMDTGMVSFVLVTLASEWQLDAQQSGWIVSVGFIGMALGAVLSGWAADRFGNTAKRCSSFRLAISTSAPINSCTDEANALPV